jgi:hypothetical protein
MKQAKFKRISTAILLGAILVAAAVLMPATAAFSQVNPPAHPASPATPATQPTADDIQAAIDAKQYAVAVRTATKLLSMRGPAAAGLDRFQITMLKGYAQAGLKANSSAVMTFRAAKSETKDPRETALANWTAELFHTAGSNIYVAKSIGPDLQKRGPFDLLNTDQRKQAFGCLLDDNLAALEPKLKVATVAQSFGQIWPVLQQVMQLDELDVIANGNDDKTSQVSGSLLDHSRNLLANALKTDWARVNDIDTHANTTVTVPTQTYVNNQIITQQTTHKIGLTSDNRTELNNIISVCQKIHDAAEVFISISKSDKDWSSILSDADRVAGRASDILSADYSTDLSGGTAVIDTSGINTYQQGTQYPNGTQYPTNSPVPAGNKTSNATPTQPPKTPGKPKSGSGS